MGALRMRPVGLAGRGLVSTLGGNLPAALDRLTAADVPMPTPRTLAPGEVWPHFPLPLLPQGTPSDWFSAARARVVAAMQEAGALDRRDLPLFIASSSIDLGAVEQHNPPIPTHADCLSFCERVAAWLDWEGPVYWISTACTSSFNALNSAWVLVATGRAEGAVIIGLELDNRFSAAGFAAMQLLSRTRPQPLAATRDGLVLGEAVAVLRLLAADDASCQKPGTPPLRWRMLSGATIVSGQDPAGAVTDAVGEVARQALARAGLSPAQIDLIKLQAAGSPRNDAVEIDGLRQVFGASLPALCSLKPWLGHCLGAAGAAELALMTAALDAGKWPTPPQDLPDPTLAAQLATQPPANCRYVLAMMMGFGGGHSAVVLEQVP